MFRLLTESLLSDEMTGARGTWIDGTRTRSMKAHSLIYPGIQKEHGLAPHGDYAVVLNMPSENQPKLDFPLGSDKHEDASGSRQKAGIRTSNYATKGAFVDLHIDGGKEGLSALLANCEKVWLLAPMTPKNSAVFQSAARVTDRYLHYCLPQLEGCIVTTTNSKEVLYIPAGCLHSTITVSAGFLIGIDFVYEGSIVTSYHTIITLLGVDGDSHAQEDLDTFCLAIEHALLGTTMSQQSAMRGWLDFGKHVLDAIGRRGAWADQAVEQVLRTWKTALDAVAELAPCPCGGEEPSHFQSHVEGDIVKIKRKWPAGIKPSKNRKITARPVAHTKRQQKACALQSSKSSKRR